MAIAFVVAALIFVLAEAVPKTYALLDTDRAALVVAPMVRALALIAPLRWITRALIGLANVLIPGKGARPADRVGGGAARPRRGRRQDAVIDGTERALIESTIEFGDTVVREVMVPRPDMITVVGEFRVADVVEVVILNGYSRLPVCR